MAFVEVHYVWADGESVHIKVKVETSFPDAVAEARSSAEALLHDVIGVTRVASVDD